MAHLLIYTQSSKSEHSYSFITSRPVRLYVHLTSIVPGIKEVKHFTKTGTSDSKSKDPQDDPIYIVRTPNKIYDLFKETMEILPLNQVIWVI